MPEDTGVERADVSEELVMVEAAVEAPGAGKAPVYESADEFLSDDEMPTDYVYLPTKKRRMKIRALRSRERAELEKRLEEVRGKGRHQTKETNMKLFREWMAVYCCIKPNGSQMFGTEHIGRLQNMAAGDINAIADAGMKLSGIGQDEVDDMVGNSDDSLSDSSPGTSASSAGTAR